VVSLSGDVKCSGFEISQNVARARLGDALELRVNPKWIKGIIKKTCLHEGRYIQEKMFFEDFVVGGDWDLLADFFENDPLYAEMADLVRFEGEYRSSPAFQLCVREVLEGAKRNGPDGRVMSSESDVDKMFSFYLGVMRSMEKYGYLDKIDENRGKQEWHVGVAVTRDEQFLHFRTGHHRLALAQLLGLDRVIVHVHCVHEEWVSSLKPCGEPIFSIKERLRKLGGSYE